MGAHAFYALLRRIDARQAAGAFSLLLHLGVLAWALLLVRQDIGMQSSNTYIEVSLKTLPAPEPRKARASKKPPPPAKAKKKRKPEKKAPVDLDELAASIASKKKPPELVAPVPPAPPPESPAQSTRDGAGSATATDSAAPAAAQGASIESLPGWCPQNEALISAEGLEPELGELYELYRGSIRNRVSDNWLIPPILAPDARCTIFIEQLVSGDIVRYEFAYCSGGEDFRRSVEEAIKRTTLPIPPDRRLYSRCIGFDFVPSEL